MTTAVNSGGPASVATAGVRARPADLGTLAFRHLRAWPRPVTWPAGMSVEALHRARIALPFATNVTVDDAQRERLTLEHETLVWLCGHLAARIPGRQWCVLKGLGLERLYPSGYHRQFADLDLLADGTTAPVIARHLVALGLWMQATAAVGRAPDGTLVWSETWRGVISPGGGPVRVRVDVHVGGISTSRGSWLTFSPSFWADVIEVSDVHGISFFVPSPWWQRELFLLECFGRARLTPRDLMDWTLMDTPDPPGARAGTVARRAMATALRAGVARAEGTKQTVHGLAWLLLRSPRLGQLLEALRAGPRSGFWHLLMLAARRSDRVAAFVGHRYPPEAGRRALEKHGAATLLLTTADPPHNWSVLHLVGGPYAIVPSEIVTAETLTHLGSEPK